MFYKVNFLEEESPVVLLCCNCAFKLPTYQEIDWSRTGDVQSSQIEELPFYELVNRRFTCPANNCAKILNFQEFKEKNCCEGATNPLLAWIWKIRVLSHFYHMQIQIKVQCKKFIRSLPMKLAIRAADNLQKSLDNCTCSICQKEFDAGRVCLMDYMISIH